VLSNRAEQQLADRRDITRADWNAFFIEV